MRVKTSDYKAMSLFTIDTERDDKFLERQKISNRFTNFTDEYILMVYKSGCKTDLYDHLACKDEIAHKFWYMKADYDLCQEIIADEVKRLTKLRTRDYYYEIEARDEEEASKFVFDEDDDYEEPVYEVYFDVPFVRKDEAKKCGAKWDKNLKKWFTMYYTEDYNKMIKKFKIIK